MTWDEMKWQVGEVKGTLSSVGTDVVSVRRMVTGMVSTAAVVAC